MSLKRAASVALLVGALGGVFAFVAVGHPRPTPIRVGVLHSLTGTMAISEKPLVDAVTLAVEEWNARGGVLGRPIEIVVADGRSDATIFAAEAERLIAGERVSVIFGCWTSASRKTVRDVVERNDHLLVYPLQHEGLERSRNVVYTGTAPNQQIVPAVKWSLDHLGRRFFFVGSDYVFPRAAAAIVRDQLAGLGGELVGEAYLPLGGRDVAPIVSAIVAAKPAVILNAINGDSNGVFFQALRAAGVSSKETPTVSFSVGEPELLAMDPAALAGDYAAWSYFQSLDTPENRDFVERFRKRHGADRVTGDPIEAAYLGVQLWAQAVDDAGTDDVGAVRELMRDQSFNAPQGVVYVDGDTRHTWKGVRIGRIEANGQFGIVWNSEHPIRPVPYPLSRTVPEWDRFLAELYEGWGRRWAGPPA